MTAAISRKKTTKILTRPHVPGRAMVGKLVRFHPDELKRIEQAARQAAPPVSSSRFIADSALRAVS